MTLGDEHTMPYTDDILWNCVLEFYVISLTNVTAICLIKMKKKIMMSEKHHQRLVKGQQRFPGAPSLHCWTPEGYPIL